MRLIILTLLLTLSLLAKDKIALVIGNKNYTNHTGLNNPIKDAKLIRDTLQGMGFEVVEAYNKDLNDLSTKLDAFIGKAKNAKIAVVYYAGHGIGVGVNNYLIPLGSSNLSVDNLGRKLMSVNELKGAVAKASGFGVVFFDACRNSLFSGSISGLANRGSRALVQPTVSTTQNILVSFSTQAGKLAKDDVNNGNHSPYALALSESLLSNSNIDIRRMMGSVRSRVLDLTSNQQYPIDENQLKGSQYCLKGFCKQYGNDAETQRLKAEIARLKHQQNTYVPPRVVTPKPVQVTHDTQGIEQIGNRMYQNQPFTKRYNWEEAKGYCQDLTLGGYDNWRLPTRDELFAIGNIKKFHRWKDYDTWKKWFDKNKHNRLKGSKGKERFVRQEFLENMQTGSYFWTSEEKDSSNAWDVRFNSGNDLWRSKTNGVYALCVR